MEIFSIDCYDILTVGIDIIGFDINIISELVFTINLYIFSTSYSFERWMLNIFHL